MAFLIKKLVSMLFLCHGLKSKVLVTLSDYCNSPVDMCTYDNILMMHNESMKASKKELTW